MQMATHALHDLPACDETSSVSRGRSIGCMPARAIRIPAISALMVVACAAAHAGDMRAEFARWEAEADAALGNKPKQAAGEKRQPPVAPKEKTCPVCGGSGKYPCPTHQKQIAFWIEGQPAPACCGGLGWIPCPRCPRDQQQANAEAYRQALEAEKTLMAELGKFKEQSGLRLTVTLTPRMAFISDLNPRSCVASAQQCEDLLRKMEKIFGCDKFAFTTAEDTRFFIFQRREGYLAFLDKVYKEMFPDADLYLCKKAMGFHHCQEPSMSFGDYSMMRSQSGMDHHVVHTYAHFLLSRLGGFKRLPVWQEEGFAAWCETLQLRQPETYCFAYEAKDVDIGSNRKRFLQEGIRKNRLCQLPTLDRLSLDGYELAHYFMSWSIVNMLIDRSPENFVTFIEAQKGGDSTEEALIKAYDYNWPKLYEVWKRYVLAGH